MPFAYANLRFLTQIYATFFDNDLIFNKLRNLRKKSENFQKKKKSKKLLPIKNKGNSILRKQIFW